MLSILLVIVVGRSVGRSDCRLVRTFSPEPWLWWIPNVDMWVGITGVWHSKSLEQRRRSMEFLRGDLKLYTAIIQGVH